MKQKKEMKANTVKENKQMGKGSYSKMEAGPSKKNEAKEGGSMGKFSGKLSAQKSEVIKGAKPKAPISDLHTAMSDQDGFLHPEASPPVTAANMVGGPEHAYLGNAKPHLKQGFRPVAGNLDAHDTERNPRKPQQTYKDNVAEGPSDPEAGESGMGY